MRRFIWFLIILVISVWLGAKVAQDPGYALFTYRDWSVETPLWFAIFVIIIFLLTAYFIIRVLDSIDFSFYRWKNWLFWRRKYKSYSKTNRGLIELIEGDWRNAEYYLLNSVAQSNEPLINYLAAAKAAHEQGAYERRDSYLRKAHQVAPQADVAIGLTQAQLQFNQGQLEQALATLGHLQSMAPKHSVILKLLERVYVRLSDWKGLLKILPGLYKAKVINAKQLEQLEHKTYLEIFLASASKAENINTLQNAWAVVPRSFQKDPAFVDVYVKQLLRYLDTTADVEDLIKKTLKKTWDKNLAHQYGLLITKDPKKQLATAETWLKWYGNQPVLLLTLGRLCVRCQLWGKAREYFEKSLSLESNPETFAEYGKLLEYLGEESAATQCYKDGLVLLAENGSRS